MYIVTLNLNVYVLQDTEENNVNVSDHSYENSSVRLRFSSTANSVEIFVQIR